MTIYILIGILVIVIFLVSFIMGTYNSLVRLKNKVENSWSQVEVLLKRRYDLIPNLVNTVKGYAKHEKTTLDEVIKARNQYATATTNSEKMEASNVISGTLSRLFALAENYPDLKANENFISLQTELSETEDKIAYARQFYNDTVMMYHDKLRVFPSNIVASMFHFKDEKYFEVAEEEKENPKVEF